MATQVKVCGITQPGDAELALSLGADFIGVIIYEKSPRAVELEKVPELLESIPKGKRVLVDVAPSAQRLESCLSLGFDAYQIHFDLDIPMASIATWSGLVGPDALWVAPRLPDSEPDFPQVLMEFAETILVDAFDKNAYGGTGHAGANWQRFLDCTLLYQHKRWILAGGLSPDNIREALGFTQAEMVDVNSGVEQSPGVKDPDRLKELFAIIRQHDRQQDDTRTQGDS
ncbi:phosphoribosylanthranilate isomerase [Puniceicoccales bacterium CK1056]|uniref:N-(5'-phosphoribosyl)anthranilate isomerase n=1 Tax=Oceanipulchritudo coccoides TaxID=2706888 RepID=A0A6B2LYR5_9BACT|nr:phosphoribosylanthranilate isomerase [Oceanipulchritudo coccoides]NDV61758.1 phosphoribosylanthranilate isomerase [Oceanipulchritudo coccoides]